MGLKVRWTTSALADLNEALDFIANDNLGAAQILGRKTRATVRRLDRYPMKGRMVPEYGNPEIRELVIGPFRILYSLAHSPTVYVIAAVRSERCLLPDEQAEPG